MSFGKAKRFDYKIRDNFPSPADYNVNTSALSERSFSINKSERFPHERALQDKAYHSSTASVYEHAKQQRSNSQKRMYSLSGPNRAVSNETVLKNNLEQEKIRNYLKNRHNKDRFGHNHNNSTLVYSDDGYIYDNYDSFLSHNNTTDEDFARFERELRHHITNNTVVNAYEKDSLESSLISGAAATQQQEEDDDDKPDRKRSLKEPLLLRQPLYSNKRHSLRPSMLQHNIISNMERFYNEFHYEKMDLIKNVKHSFELLMNDFYASTEKTFYDLHRKATLNMLEYVASVDHAGGIVHDYDLGQEIRKTNRNISEHHDTVTRVLVQQDSLIKYLQEKVEQLSSDRQKFEKAEKCQV